MTDSTASKSLASPTPGPWFVGTSDNGWATRRTLSIVAEATPREKYHRMMEIAVATGSPNWGDGHSEREANARLIAAAPELLFAARLAYRTLIERVVAKGESTPELERDEQHAFAILQSAIRKADGAQP